MAEFTSGTAVRRADGMPSVLRQHPTPDTRHRGTSRESRRMTTYREDRATDVREDAGAIVVDAPSPVPSAIASPPDGEPLIGAVLDLVHDLDEQVCHLKVALQSNRRIGIAIGIVMSQLRISDEEAFSALRQVSQSSNRKLRDVAEDVIYAGHLDGADGSRDEALPQER